MKIKFPKGAKTQKAKGVLSLLKHGGMVSVPMMNVYSLPLSADDRKEISTLITYPGTTFVRPCPTTPRHGFVESRSVTTLEQVQEIEKESLRADENAELIVMPYIEASANMVLTPWSVAIGEGTDGATQGKNVWELPLSNVAISEQVKHHAGITECPFIEAVYNKESSHDYRHKIVQIRNGPYPAEDFKGNYVPETMTVQNIINAEGEGLEFEEEIKAAPEGTILDHRGGTMLSHYAVHAQLKGVPIIFEDPLPQVGQVLEKTVTDDKPVHTKRFLEGLEAGTNIDLDPSEEDNESEVLKTCLTLIHNAGSLMHSYDGAFLLGMSSTVVVRFAYSASLGEYRHVQKHRNRRPRDQVYKEILADWPSFIEHRKKIKTVEKSFFNSRRWGILGGFGGSSWGKCTQQARALEQEIVKFIRKPDEQGMRDILSALHNVVNAAHNNGAFLNKFCEDSHFEFAASGLLDHTVRSMFDAYRLIGKLDSSTNNLRSWRRVHLQSIEEPPKRKKIQRLQFRTAGENHGNRVFHFQYGKKGKYQNADLHEESLSDTAVQFLEIVVNHGNTMKSLAPKSKKEYSVININEDIPDSLLRELSKQSIHVQKTEKE